MRKKKKLKEWKNVFKFRINNRSKQQDMVRRSERGALRWRALNKYRNFARYAKHVIRPKKELKKQGRSRHEDGEEKIYVDRKRTLLENIGERAQNRNGTRLDVRRGGMT